MQDDDTVTLILDGVRQGDEAAAKTDVTVLPPAQESDYAAGAPTELGESLSVLMDDTIEADTRMSGIDMRSNLAPFQVSNIIAFDGMVSFGVIPRDCLFLSRQVKRVSCSIKGWRANQIVETVVGKREADKMGGMDRFKSFFGMGNNGGA